MPCGSARHVQTRCGRPVLPCVVASGRSLSLPSLMHLSPAAYLRPDHVRYVPRSAAVSDCPARQQQQCTQ